MSTLEIGIVGAGEIAKVGHLPAYDACSSTNITAVADLNRQRANAAAQTYDIPNVYESGSMLLQKESIDVLSICTPPNTHKELFIDAADRGIDIFCEKPFATSVNEAKAMHEAAASSEIKTAIGYSNRYFNNYRKVLTYANRGILGELYKATVTCFVPPPETDWRYDRSVAGGGIVADMASHWIDFYLELGDGEANVSITQVEAIDTKDVEDYANFRLIFDDYTVDMTFRWMDSGPTSSAVRQNQLMAENATISFDRTLLDGNINWNGVRFKRGVLPSVSLGPLFNFWWGAEEKFHQKSVSAFIDHIVDDKREVASSKRALEVTKIRQQIYEGFKS